MAKAQKGQVLALGLLCVMLLTLVMLRFFYVGQINSTVVRQRHALDAATYSGAVAQAQALNYLSYVNRASTGHQIAMAHLITMASWAHFAGTEAQRVSMGNPPTSLIGMMFGPTHGAAYQAAILASGAQVHAQRTGIFGRAYQQHDAFSLGFAEPVSRVIYQQLPQWREQVIRQLLQDNYTEYDFSQNNDAVQLTITDDNWFEAVSWQSGLSLAPWLKAITDHYAFLAPRNHTVRNMWAVDPRCPHKRHELRRRGQTLLDETGQWQAEDTQSFHALRSNRWVGCYFREYAMGWAWVPSQYSQQPDSDYVDEAPIDFSQQDFWRWVQEHTSWNIFTGSSNPLATSWAKKDQVQWQGQGIASYVDTTAPQSTVHFQTKLKLLDSKGQWISSQSGAESYFIRPTRRADQYKESSNVFHAFWQARLQHNAWQQRLQQLLEAR